VPSFLFILFALKELQQKLRDTRNLKQCLIIDTYMDNHITKRIDEAVGQWRSK